MFRFLSGKVFNNRDFLVARYGVEYAFTNKDTDVSGKLPIEIKTLVAAGAVRLLNLMGVGQ